MTTPRIEIAAQQKTLVRSDVVLFDSMVPNLVALEVLPRITHAILPAATDAAAPSPLSSSRTLIVDGRGAVGDHRARSRGEALELITANEYDTIVLHTLAAGCDEYHLIAYLAGTWPSFLQTVAIRTVTRGAADHQWNHAAARFDALPSRPRRARSVTHPSAQPLELRAR